MQKKIAIEISNIIRFNQLLINIDEVKFSKSAKTNYCWLIKEEMALDDISHLKIYFKWYVQSLQVIYGLLQT